jgi:hypothetical protein
VMTRGEGGDAAAGAAGGGTGAGRMPGARLLGLNRPEGTTTRLVAFHPHPAYAASVREEGVGAEAGSKRVTPDRTADAAPFTLLSALQLELPRRHAA